jgi:threonine/homoserine/homoserine lactone efflux protein
MVVNIDKMAFRNYIHVLAAAFLMGLAAAAPMGPVNMMAIRRGVAGGWRHTLACGIGSVFGDLFLFSLALAGGSYLLPGLMSPRLHTAFDAVGAAILVPVGISFLVLAARHPRRAYRRARRLWGKEALSSFLLGEAAKSAALTLFNPLSIVYWAAVTTTWLTFARPVLGIHTAGWGILMAGAGLISWFSALILFVRFVPQYAGVSLFRAANAILGLILLAFGTYCAVDLSRRLLHHSSDLIDLLHS